MVARSWFLLLSLIGAALLFSPGASAQLSSASINGTVQDNSGSVVVGASLTLRNFDTQVARETTTGADGHYTFLEIPPGRYSLEVKATGFATARVDSFTLAVNQTSTFDLKLQVGQVQQSVTVEAQGTQVEGSTAELGAVIAQRQVVDLPLNGRNFTQLLTLTPGAAPISVGQNRTGGNTAATLGSAFTFPSVNGQSNRSNYYLLDGMDNQNAQNY